MKYTDSKNNITFNNVKEAGVYHASGPIGLNGLYTTNGANITDINSNLSLINAIDINWNGALVEPGVILNTTGDLLRWIKEHSGNGQETIELTIDSQGYWCINGVSTGVKALGENGLTPFIGSNGNWWIGTTDTGVSANAKTVVENNISYTSDISGTTTGSYRLGTLTVGNNNYPILGKDLDGGSGNIAVSYLDSVGTTAPGRYTIGTLQIGNNAPITLNGIDTKGEGSGEGGDISKDDVLGWVASVGYALLTDVNGAIANLTTEYTTAINDAKTWASTQFETKSNASQAIANLTTEFNKYTLTEDLINYIKSQNIFSLKSDGGGSSINLDAIYEALDKKLDKDDFEGTLTRSLAYLTLNSRLGEAETALGTKVSQSDYNSKISDLEASIAAAAAGVSPEELLRLINNTISGNYVSTSAFAEFQSTLKGSEATIEANFKKLAIEVLDEDEGIAKVTAISNGAFSDYIAEQNLVKASTLAEYAKTTYVDGKILELTTATSGLKSRIEALENGDFVSESELLSKIDDKIASITTLVTKTDNGDGTYSIDSNIKLSADLIELDGETIFRKLSADLDNGISYNGHEGIIINPTKVLFYSSVYNGAARSYAEINVLGMHVFEDMRGLPMEIYCGPEGIELYYGYDDDRPGELIKKVDIDYNQAYFDVPTTINNDLDVTGAIRLNGGVESSIIFNDSNGDAGQSITSNGTYLDLGSDGKIRIGTNSINFYEGSDAGSFVVNHERIYLGDTHCDTIRLGDPDADTTIQLYGDIVTGNGDINIGHDLTVSGTITTNNLSLSPDGTNGTFLASYGLYSVYNKSYSGSWGGEQLRIKLSLQTGSNDDSTVECAVNNIKLLGNYVSVGNFDGGASGMIVRDSNVELRSQTNIKFDNIITLAPAINGTEKIIANFLYNDNDLEIETPNGVCKIPDLYSDSDETIKENITEVSSNILDIANARIVDFNFKGKSTIKFGSIAQDWKNIFPNAVKETTSGILCMDYGAIALGSAVTAAREIVALKEENQQLKDRLAAIEQKLEAINSALG